MQQIVPVAIFLAVAALIWWAMEAMASKPSRTLDRLEAYKKAPARRSFEDTLLAEPDGMAKILKNASPAFARPLQPKSAAEISRLRARLAAAGFRSEAAGSVFLGLKLFGLLTGLVLSTGIVLPLAGIGKWPLVSVAGIAGLLFYMPDLVVWFIGHSHKQSIFLGLPDALDLMVVCVEAGLGLDQAMRKVADEMRKAYRVLAEEFSVCNFQLQMGRPKVEVLRELGARTGVADLRSLAAVLIQTDKFGSSVSQALRVQSNSMRTRRRQLAEEKAAKTAVQLIFPLVLFIFPGIFIILVGPAGIAMVRQMFPAMSGG